MKEELDLLMAAMLDELAAWQEQERAGKGKYSARFMMEESEYLQVHEYYQDEDCMGWLLIACCVESGLRWQKTIAFGADAAANSREWEEI